MPKQQNKIDWSKKITVAEKQQKKARNNREKFKANRAEKVRRITVTTAAGNTFDGDEDSQNRMARAIVGALNDSETIEWTLADNSVIDVDREELTEALRLSGLRQNEFWRPDEQ